MGGSINEQTQKRQLLIRRRIIWRNRGVYWGNNWRYPGSGLGLTEQDKWYSLLGKALWGQGDSSDHGLVWWGSYRFAGIIGDAASCGDSKAAKKGTNKERPYRRMGVLLYGFFYVLSTVAKWSSVLFVTTWRADVGIRPYKNYFADDQWSSLQYCI